MEMVTNRKFSEEDEVFKTACAEVGLPNHVNTTHSRKGSKKTPGSTSLTRQASKWRNKRGLAWKTYTNKEV